MRPLLPVLSMTSNVVRGSRYDKIELSLGLGGPPQKAIDDQMPELTLASGKVFRALDIDIVGLGQNRVELDLPLDALEALATDPIRSIVVPFEGQRFEHRMSAGRGKKLAKAFRCTLDQVNSDWS